MKHTRSKVRNNFIHFKRRMRERYGVDVDRSEYKQICNQIKNNKSVFLGRQTACITVHQVAFRGIQIIVVYNSNTGNICTTLFPGRSYQLI